jgi:excisionase family DNA binding protein
MRLTTTTRAELLTTAEAAKSIGVAQDTVRKYIQRKLIKPFGTIGSAYLMTAGEVERYKNEKRPRGNPLLQKKRR